MAPGVLDMNSWFLKRRGVASVLTLRRPPINALDRQALNELSEAVETVEADEETRVLIIASGIERVFCTGGDLKYWRHIRDGKEVSRIGCEVFARLESLPKPTLAAINGHVVGDGLALALACDLRMASETATFRLPELAYGFIPGWGLIHRLIALMGRAKASNLLLTGRSFQAAEVLSMGLVHEVAPPDQLLNKALERTREMEALSPAALRAAKCALLGGDEAACFRSVWGGRDWQEGIDAWLDKRNRRIWTY